jgi:hypothetical protein
MRTRSCTPRETANVKSPGVASAFGPQVTTHATSAGRMSIYPTIYEALASTGMATIESTVSAWQSFLVDRIATRLILEICREAERLSGSTVGNG